MNKFGIIVEFNNKDLICDDVIVPIWKARDNWHNTTLNRYKIKQLIQQADNPRVEREVTERIVKNIDSKYEKANLEEISQSAHQLDTKEQVVILNLLKDF